MPPSPRPTVGSVTLPITHRCYTYPNPSPNPPLLHPTLTLNLTHRSYTYLLPARADDDACGVTVRVASRILT